MHDNCHVYMQLPFRPHISASEIHLCGLMQQRSEHQDSFVSFLAHGFASFARFRRKAALGDALKLSTSFPGETGAPVVEAHSNHGQKLVKYWEI